MFSEDLTVFLNDFAVDATFNAETQKVLVDLPDEILAGDGIVTGKFKITYITGGFASMTYDSAITVNGKNYTVNEIVQIDDGSFTEAYLSEA